MATPPPPPRQTGDSEQDILSIAQWASAFYKAVVLEGEYVQASQALAALPADFDASDLTDPASATIGTAQQTANDAYLLALQASQAAATLLGNLDEGEFTISNTATTASITLTENQDDTTYQVAITPKSFTGAPATEAFIIVGVTPAIGSFGVTVGVAPGAATSVTYGWVIYRKG